ncbi:MAG TPA: hypothetical protein VGB48_02905 [Allosphingosinicella sp.]|jgi:hypothetical protein
MESNARYYERRAAEELRAAARAVTPEARERRRALAELFASKAAECGGAPAPIERTLVAAAAAA